MEDGVFAAACQNGLGVARGTFAGVAAADLAAGLSTPFTAQMEAAPAPTRLSPFLRIGAPLALRWKEAKAGRDL